MTFDYGTQKRDGNRHEQSLSNISQDIGEVAFHFIHTMKAIILACILSIFCLPAFAQGTNQWQAKAVEKYPALGVQGSELNKRFVDAYNKRLKTNPSFFGNPQWPVILADELATAPLGISPTRQLPEAVAQTMTRPAAQPIPQLAERGSGIPGIVASAITLIIVIYVAKAVKRRRRRTRIYAEARKYLGLVQREHALPTVSANLILKSGENAFYAAPSDLFETRAVRHYQSGFAGFRVAKGIYIGGSQGRSISSQEWNKIDSGVLIITNKRLIFDGGGANRSVALDKILSADSSIDGIEISVENRQKSMVFTTPNPLIVATIIRICSQVENPLNLSQTTLDISYTN